MKEVTIPAAQTDRKAVEKLIANFKFIPAPEPKDIKIPILTPTVKEDVPGSDPEPVYDSAAQDDIQGNIIPGFNKDHQTFLFFSIGDPKKGKVFLKWIVPFLASMEEVLAFRRLFRALKLKVGEPITMLCSTWINIAFSHRAIALLESAKEADAFGDQSFRQGLAQRSALLGDPTDPAHKGHPSHWVVGGPHNEADIVVIVASDSPALLEETVDVVLKKAEGAGLQLICHQRGDTLPGNFRGHEHFGFKDGVSQPGIRGKLSTAPGDYITPRYFSPKDPRRLFFAKPGQLLAWPGQFLLGEQRQGTDHLYHPVPPAGDFPKWAARGSYLVVRRLQQDVPAFWNFVFLTATHAGLSPDKVAAMLIGRWPSGAPILRSPEADAPALGADTFANNHFLFDDPARPADLHAVPGYPGDAFPQGMGDFLASVCPHFAHIRKVNPRDSATDLGKPQDNLARTILRRGIPYGPPVIGIKNPGKDLLQQERGLMFLSYAGSMEHQFEFLQRRWCNSPVQPNFGGHDPIIGQNGGAAGRERFIEFPAPAGPLRIRFHEEWVTPTGGGYFFAPAISAISKVLAR
ncbi:Dyp-type peroxidase [Paraflavisolibacter sp. H34]|uniref:Dyp-type peroxidase n=1 Tax=Huijunlia imazamoxiresistens TaxID=3127457 RepID=UPI0030199C9E